MGVENSGFLLLHFKNSIHSSWLILAGSLGILVGTYSALHYNHWNGIHWLVVAICLIVVGLMRRNIASVVLIVAGGVLIGLWRGGSELQARDAYVQWYGENVTVRGGVAEDVSYDADGDLRFRLKQASVNEQEVSGEIWVSTNERHEIKRSDIVVVNGQLSEGFGNIPAAIFRARIAKIERQAYADVARDVRDSFGGGIREAVREPEASLGAGFLVGQKTALPEKLDQELRLLGLTHIVVASGYNLTILVRFARRAFAKISRFTALAFSGGMVYCFALVTGFSPSMSRASLIAILSLLAWYYGRKFHPFVLLGFSAAVTVVIQPAYAWGDIGWLLSFTSFIGVIMLAPLLHAYFWGDEKQGSVRQVFIETLSAQLLTLPIIAYVFGQYSPLAIVANVLVLPLIPFAMLFTFVAGIGGLVLIPIAGLVGLPAEILLGYMTVVVDRLAQLPLAGSEISFSITGVAVFYLAIFVVMHYMWRRTGYAFREHNVVT